MFRISLAALALTATAASAQIADTTTYSTQEQGPALGFTLRGGVKSAPEYFGASETGFGPTASVELNHLRLGGYTFGNPDPLYEPRGFGLIGSLRYIGERDDSDNPELAGLDDVDASLELGAGVRYATRNLEAFGKVRYGVIGHEGFVGELGADVIARPTDRLTLTLGPRALFGDSDYSSTYFGVTAAEAGNSSFTEFDAGGGLVSTGVELGAGYQINDNWGIDATVNYDRLRGDAADSPITVDDTAVSASIGVTRRFTLGF
ncbi:MipA/OmpV family protein [Jannaschia rubra]|uniref:MltA-interacting protein MipA n=1 Tax=Jannaschia rubra TaxID=282197 RepID=A0A0M6XL56_9RHOB|nr:MipA/OmpV family protein [Jannaschia rubra]CTQ31648.1 MltA-interacting protein MipA [Jannaschia rubra]SFF75720.1 MltA-interacting protein MipA [Jannaschia rubra]